MTVQSAYAPFNLSYAETAPYLSVAEYQNAPTAMDTSNLLAGQGPAAQLVALKETIGRASSMIDSILFGAFGTLNATVNTENARIWGNRDGGFVVHPKYWPVLEVQSFSFAPVNSPAVAASVTPAGNIWVEPSQFIVAPAGVVGLGLGSLLGVAPGYPYLCTWDYVNGWPNTSLSASVASGAASVTVGSATGIYPDSVLTIYDLPNDETVTVAPSYVPGGTVLPLTGTTQYGHASGTQVTNIPARVKQAAISLTTFLIKARGSGALVVADIAGNVSGSGTSLPHEAMDDYALAKDILAPLRTPYVGY